MELSGLYVTPHAFERYIERLRPGITLKRAHFELLRMIEANGEWRTEPPAWASSAANEVGVRGYIFLGEDVALPVVEWRVVTLLVRGMMHEGHRAHLNRRAKGKRAARATRRRYGVQSPGGYRGRPPPEGWDTDPDS